MANQLYSDGEHPRDSPETSLSIIVLPSFTDLLHSTNLPLLPYSITPQHSPSFPLYSFSPSVSDTPSLRVLIRAAQMEISDISDISYKRKQIIKLLDYPLAGELVARKPIKFSLFVKGEFNGKLYVVATLVDSFTLVSIKNGMGEKLKNSPLRPTSSVKQQIVPYRDNEMILQIVTGSTKRSVRNKVKFELRLYDDENYVVIHSVFSPSYRIFTHSSQLGREY